MKVGYKSEYDNQNNDTSIKQDNILIKEDIKYLVWHIEGGLGKNIASTALLESIHQKYRGRKIIIVASYPEVFLNNEYVYRVYRLGSTPYFYNDYIENKDTLVFRHEPYFQTNHITKKKHLIENWADILEVDYKGQYPKIQFNVVQKQMPISWLRKKPILLLQTNGGSLHQQKLNYSWTRDIPHKIANQIVNEFKDDYHIMQITREGSIPLDNVEIIDYPVTNMELFGLVAVSEKRVLIDSSLQHVAAALNLPSTVLWIGTSPKIFGYSTHSNLTATPPKGNVKLIDSYLFDYSFDGTSHECPYMDVNEMFDINEIINTIKNT